MLGDWGKGARLSVGARLSPLLGGIFLSDWKSVRSLLLLSHLHKEMSGQILMLSDIRHDTHGQAVRNKNIQQAEALVEEDMQLQATFAKLLQCDSVLKFRAPWPHKSKNSETIETNGFTFCFFKK